MVVWLRKRADPVLQLCFELAKLSLHALDRQVLVPELLGLSLEVNQLLQGSLIDHLQLCYPESQLLHKHSQAMH